MVRHFDNAQKIKGSLKFPGDKSISHRALLFSALADGRSKIINLSSSLDVNSTKQCLQDLGVSFIERKNSILVNGVGFKGFHKPEKPLYAGNSGTTARLLAGILAGQNFESIITGDDSLSSRPMKRIIDPLDLMGVKTVHSNYLLPVHLIPPEEIMTVDYTMPVASAQVKSMIFLAGLHSEKITSVKEHSLTRDHTERMLNLKSIVSGSTKTIYCSKSNYPEPASYYVPGDVSSAAFFVVLTLLSQNSELVIEEVSLNPSRIVYLELLKKMGGNITFDEVSSFNNEPFGNIIVRSSSLTNIKISVDEVPHIIDEIPILAVAGLFADGVFQIENASELRKKESDRISSIVWNLKTAGIKVLETPDGFSFKGGQVIKEKVVFNSFNDHRIAMSFAVLSMLLKQGSGVENFNCVNISNPAFLNQLNSLL